jgi:hypothetical protein
MINYLRNRIFGVLVLFCCVLSLHAQQLKFTQGVAITEFIYQNNQGQRLTGLKPGSGAAMSIDYHRTTLVDSAVYKVSQTPFAIYLNQNPRMARLLMAINYDLGLQFLQMNAVGDIQNNQFSYQTNFVGFQGKLGIRIPLPFKFSINVQGIGGAIKMIQGNQLLVNRYISLVEDKQFGQVKFMAGYGGELDKQISTKLTGFVSYQNSFTVNSNPVGASELNFKPTVLSLGLRFSN